MPNYTLCGVQRPYIFSRNESVQTHAANWLRKEAEITIPSNCFKFIPGGFAVLAIASHFCSTT